MKFKRFSGDLPNPRLMICDVDRTLLTHDHELLPEVIEAARTLKDAGIPLVLASARSPIGLARVHQHVDVADAVICFNGAWVGSFGALEAIAEKRIPRDLAIDAMATVHKRGGAPIWFLLDGCIAHRSDEVIARYHADVTGDPLALIDRSVDAPETPYKTMATWMPKRPPQPSHP